MQDFSFIDISKYRDLYKSPFNVTIDTTPWYRDWTWSTLFWICGGICTAGIFYVGYQSWYEPMYIYNWIKGIPSIRHTGATPPTDNIYTTRRPFRVRPSTFGPVLDDSPSLFDKGKSVSKGFVSAYKYLTYKINPFNWVASVSETREQFKTFMEYQNNVVTADRNLYPFTNDNPFDSWFKKLRIHYFGESATELVNRLGVKDVAEEIYNEIKVSRGGTEVITQASTSGAKTFFSTPNSPVFAPSSPSLPTNTLGLTNYHVSPFAAVLPIASPEQIATLKAISTPSSPILPQSPSLFATTTEWANFDKPSVITIDESVTSSRLNPATRMGIDPLAGIEVHENKFSVLSDDK